MIYTETVRNKKLTSEINTRGVFLNVFSLSLELRFTPSMAKLFTRREYIGSILRILKGVIWGMFIVVQV